MKFPSNPTKKRPWTRLEKLLWLAPVGIVAAFWLPWGFRKWRGSATRQIAYPANVSPRSATEYAPKTLGVSSDGQTLISCDDGLSAVRLHVWNTDGWGKVKSWKLPLAPTPMMSPYQLGASSNFYPLPDGKTLIYDRTNRSPTMSRWLQAVDVPSQRVLWKYKLPHLVRAQGVSKDGRRVMVLQKMNNRSADTELDVLDTATGKALLTMPKIYNGLLSTLSPDGKTVVLQTDALVYNGLATGRSVQLWRVADGKLLSSIHPPLCLTTSILFSPDGGRLFIAGNNSCGDTATGSEDKSVATVYDVKSGALLWQREIPKVAHETQYTRYKMPGTLVDGIESPAWSPDGKRLAFLCDTGLLVFDDEGTLLHTLHYQLDKGCSPPCFSPDGRTLYALNRDAIWCGIWVNL